MTRQPQTFLAGLPAFATLVGLGVLVSVAQLQDSSDMIPRYTKSAQKALWREDYEAAELLYRKASSLDPKKAEARYGMAEIAERQGKHWRAWRLMNTIAKVEESGYTKAHFWIADRLMQRCGLLKADLKRYGLESRVIEAELSKKETATDKSNTLLASKLKQKQEQLAETQKRLADTTGALKQHLIFTIQQDPKHMVANAYLAQVYLDESFNTETNKNRQKLIAKAKFHLKAGHEYSPELMLRYAGLQAATGEGELGRLLAGRASELFKKYAIRDSTNVVARIRWAHAEALRGNEQGVVEILTAGIRETKNKVFNQELAKYFVDQAAIVVDDPQDPTDDLRVFAKKMNYLQKAITVDPTNPVALSTIVALSTSDDDDEEPRTSEKKVRNALASGAATAVLHLILGTSAVRDEKYEIADLHLKQALTVNYRMADVLSNLAWLLSVQKPPKTKHALELLDIANKILPQHSAIRETRGRLHASQGNWESALVDLEFALQSSKGRIGIHDTLALCYEKLGNDSLADFHRQKSIKLKPSQRDLSTGVEKDEPLND